MARGGTRRAGAGKEEAGKEKGISTAEDASNSLAELVKQISMPAGWLDPEVEIPGCTSAQPAPRRRLSRNAVTS